MKQLVYLTIAILLTVFVVSCKEDDPPLPDNTINFSASELGIDENESSKSFTINIDRSSTSPLSIVLKIVESGLVYGTSYTTTPAASNGEITVSIPAGETSANIAIQKVAGKFFDGNETLSLSVGTIPKELVLGSTTALKITFGAIVSAGSELTLNGGEGGSKAANSVYVDLSNNEQTAIARKSWNLALYCGEGFAAKLNNTTASTAIEANIGVETVVNATDSASYATALTLTTTAEAMALIDDYSGDLSKTVIKEGKVYVLNLGESQTPLYKVKVTSKDASTYTVQYSKINESAVKSIDVAKNPAYNFVYVSFAEGKTVQVEPAKTKWDIVWGRSVYYTNMGTGAIPYTFADLVLLNSKTETQAVEVLTETKAYAGFSATDATSLTYSSSIDVIGSKWRNGGGPTTQPSVKTDRFYVIKDSSGNIYKLQFVSMGPGDGGTRGYPQIKYELLK